jgi:hypothetical protein
LVPKADEGAVMGGRGDARGEPVQVAAEVLAAIAGGQVRDLLQRVSPQIVCIPATRPDRSVYRGHAGMIQLVADLHAAHGPYHLEHEDACAEGSAQHCPDGETLVTVRAQIVRETPRGDVPGLRIMVRVMVRGGLVTSMYADYLDGSSVGRPGEAASAGTPGEATSAGTPGEATADTRGEATSPDGADASTR